MFPEHEAQSCALTAPQSQNFANAPGTSVGCCFHICVWCLGHVVFTYFGCCFHMQRVLLEHRCQKVRSAPQLTAKVSDVPGASAHSNKFPMNTILQDFISFEGGNAQGCELHVRHVCTSHTRCLQGHLRLCFVMSRKTYVWRRCLR